MQLEELCENRTPGKTLKAHNWSSYCWQEGDNGLIICNINHYWTQMLQFVIKTKKPYYPIPVRHVQHVDIGHGSKSDQNGMNRIFIKLGLPWYYARNHKSPRILTLPRDNDELPKYLQNREVRVNVFGYAA